MSTVTGTNGYYGNSTPTDVQYNTQPASFSYPYQGAVPIIQQNGFAYIYPQTPLQGVTTLTSPFAGVPGNCAMPFAPPQPQNLIDRLVAEVRACIDSFFFSANAFFADFTESTCAFVHTGNPQGIHAMMEQLCRVNPELCAKITFSVIANVFGPQALQPQMAFNGMPTSPADLFLQATLSAPDLVLAYVANELNVALYETELQGDQLIQQRIQQQAYSYQPPVVYPMAQGPADNNPIYPAYAQTA